MCVELRSRIDHLGKCWTHHCTYMYTVMVYCMYAYWLLNIFLFSSIVSSRANKPTTPAEVTVQEEDSGGCGLLYLHVVMAPINIEVLKLCFGESLCFGQIHNVVPKCL